jgi:hypothetical protein
MARQCQFCDTRFSIPAEPAAAPASPATRITNVEGAQIAVARERWFENPFSHPPSRESFPADHRPSASRTVEATVARVLILIDPVEAALMTAGVKWRKVVADL